MEFAVTSHLRTPQTDSDYYDVIQPVQKDNPPFDLHIFHSWFLRPEGASCRFVNPDPTHYVGDQGCKILIVLYIQRIYCFYDLEYLFTYLAMFEYWYKLLFCKL